MKETKCIWQPPAKGNSELGPFAPPMDIPGKTGETRRGLRTSGRLPAVGGCSASWWRRALLQGGKCVTSDAVMVTGHCVDNLSPNGLVRVVLCVHVFCELEITSRKIEGKPCGGGNPWNPPPSCMCVALPGHTCRLSQPPVTRLQAQLSAEPTSHFLEPEQH